MKHSGGWTLMELLIVIAIIGILALLYLLTNWKQSLYRANDARRKTDLANIRRAFEEYYNDHNCYPPVTILSGCGGTGLSPYLDKVPCDPTTRQSYLYKPDSDTNTCTGNRVCAQLQDWADPDITSLGCDPKNGCGWGAYWNYCLATGTTVTAPGFVASISPTPGPSPTPSYAGPYACTRDGICNNVGNPAAAGCPESWSQPNCLNSCGDVALRCP